MGGPELAAAPPAVKGLAILLSAELGAKEYFGWTEAAACESYREGWWERGRQCTATAHDMRVKTTFDTRCKLSLLLHNPEPSASWYFLIGNDRLPGFSWLDLMAPRHPHPRAQTHKRLRSASEAIFFFALAASHKAARVICCSWLEWKQQQKKKKDGETVISDSCAFLRRFQAQRRKKAVLAQLNLYFDLVVPLLKKGKKDKYHSAIHTLIIRLRSPQEILTVNPAPKVLSGIVQGKNNENTNIS